MFLALNELHMTGKSKRLSIINSRMNYTFSHADESSWQRGCTLGHNPVAIKGSSSFRKPLINLAENPESVSVIVKDLSKRHITVCGGSKTAHDAVYKLATNDKKVYWVIAESGHGATPMIPTHLQIGPYKIWTEKFVMLRLLAWLNPCIWGHFDGFGALQQLMQTTQVGRHIVYKTLNFVQAGIFHSGISSDPETKKLMPDQSLRFYGSGTAILNYPTDFYQTIRCSQVEIFRKGISHLEHGIVRLTDGSAISTDAILCHTGWKHIPSVEFHPSTIHADIGIPSRDCLENQMSEWTALDDRADLEILMQLPILIQDRPKSPRRDPITNDGTSTNIPTPWRLWRGIAPASLEFRNIVFLGMFDCPQTCLRAEASALWVYAYMFNKLEEPIKSISTMPSRRVNSQKERLFDTALFQRFSFWRTPYGHGAKYVDSLLEGLPYIDMLLQDLGLRSWRKEWSWVGEVFGGGYWQKNYIGLIGEWKERQREKDEKRSNR